MAWRPRGSDALELVPERPDQKAEQFVAGIEPLARQRVRAERQDAENAMLARAAVVVAHDDRIFLRETAVALPLAEQCVALDARHHVREEMLVVAPCGRHAGKADLRRKE